MRLLDQKVTILDHCFEFPELDPVYLRIDSSIFYGKSVRLKNNTFYPTVRVEVTHSYVFISGYREAITNSMSTDFNGFEKGYCSPYHSKILLVEFVCSKRTCEYLVKCFGSSKNFLIRRSKIIRDGESFMSTEIFPDADSPKEIKRNLKWLQKLEEYEDKYLEIKEKLKKKGQYDNEYIERVASLVIPEKMRVRKFFVSGFIDDWESFIFNYKGDIELFNPIKEFINKERLEWTTCI